MPRALASRGLPIATGCPLTRICPESGGRAPDSVLMSVVFPAPLPPTSPTTSPVWRSIVTRSTARTPPKETWMFRSSTSGIRAGVGAGVGVAGCWLIIVRSTHPPPHDRVQADGRDEHHADHDVLGRRVDEQKHHTRA